MKKIKQWMILGVLLIVLIMIGCEPEEQINPKLEATDLQVTLKKPQHANSKGGGAITANGWYEEEEIYYILSGIEEGVTERGENDLYLIGGDRAFQGNVAEFIPGEPGYTPHWNVNIVNTAPGIVLDDILASPYASAHYPEALFDDVEDILDAQDAGLVTIVKPGVVVLCPIIPEMGAEAPGHTELSEDFPPFPATF